MHQHLSRHPPSRVCRPCVLCPRPVGGARRGAKRPRVQRALGGRLERREGQRRIRTCHRKIKGLRFSAFRAKRETGENPSCNCRCRDPPSTPLGPCAPLPPCLFGPLCSLPPLAHVRESAEPRCPWALPPSCCVAGHPASPALAADALGSATAAAWQLPGLASPRLGLFFFSSHPATPKVKTVELLGLIG